MSNIPDFLPTVQGDFEVCRVPSLLSCGKVIGYKIQYSAKRILINGGLCAAAQHSAFARVQSALSAHQVPLVGGVG